MIAKRSITDHNQLCLARPTLDVLERFDQRRQSIAWIEAAEEENRRHIAREPSRRRGGRIKNVGVDAVWNDLPIRIEITIQRDRGAVRHRNRAAQHVQSLLEVTTTE